MDGLTGSALCRFIGIRRSVFPADYVKRRARLLLKLRRFPVLLSAYVAESAWRPVLRNVCILKEKTCRTAGRNVKIAVHDSLCGGAARKGIMRKEIVYG